MSILDSVRSAISQRRHGADVGAPTLVITADACRFGTFEDAYDGQFGELKPAFSPACWTLPAHEAIVRGNLPTPPGERTGDAFDNEYPDTYLPLPRLHAESWLVAEMPYLHAGGSVDSPIPRYFGDVYETSHGDTTGTAARVRKCVRRESSWFGLVNFGATHFPYQHFDGDFEAFLDAWDDGSVSVDDLKRWQTAAAAEVIAAVESIAAECPDGTNIILTADHGDLFGERDAFGHNYAARAQFDESLHRVPLVSWTVGESRGEAVGDVGDEQQAQLEALGYVGGESR